MLSTHKTLTLLFSLSLLPFSILCKDKKCCIPDAKPKSSSNSSSNECSCSSNNCSSEIKSAATKCRACRKRHERGEVELCRKCRVRKRRYKIAQNKKPQKETRFSLLDYDGLKKAKNQLVKKGNREIAVKYIEKMVQQCTDLGELASLMIELADLLFDLGKTAGAERLYSEFVHLYPGDQKAEYASYKAILCSFWATLDCVRDQSKTKETIEFAQKFLEQKNIFKKYSNQVQEILTSCHEKLFESEQNIFQFYLKGGNYLAAKTRLENIEKEFILLLPDKEPVLITLACDLAEKTEDKELLTQKQAELEQKFPEFVQQKNLVAKTKIRNKQADQTTKHQANRF